MWASACIPMVVQVTCHAIVCYASAEFSLMIFSTIWHPRTLRSGLRACEYCCGDMHIPARHAEPSFEKQVLAVEPKPVAAELALPCWWTFSG